MFPQRQILYFLYQSHQNHNLFSIFRYSRALYRLHLITPTNSTSSPSCLPQLETLTASHSPLWPDFPWLFHIPSLLSWSTALTSISKRCSRADEHIILPPRTPAQHYALSGESKPLPVHPVSKSHRKNNLFLLAATLTSASPLKGCAGDLPHLSNYIFPQKLLVSATHLSQGLLFLKAPHGTEPLPHARAAHAPLLLLFTSNIS